MPRKPSKKRIMKRQLTETEIAYLSDDRLVTEKGNYILWCYRHGMPGFDGDPKPDELWQEHGGDFLPAFILKHPGKRPLPKWQWSSPRQQDQGSGFFYEGTLPEPRLRIGGKGETTWEKYPAVVPSYQRSIPSGWAWIDENDPPCFESEATFLDRHGFLTPAEKKILAKMPEAWEPEKLNCEKEVINNGR